MESQPQRQNAGVIVLNQHKNCRRLKQAQATAAIRGRYTEVETARIETLETVGAVAMPQRIPDNNKNDDGSKTATT